MVIKSLRSDFKNHGIFMTMIILAQMLAAFILCFASGIVKNGSYVSMEDKNNTLVLDICSRSSEDLFSRESMDPVLNKILDIIGGKQDEVEYCYSWTDDEGKLFFFYGFGKRLDDGTYTTSRIIDETYDYQVSYGRNITDEDEKTGSCVMLSTVDEVGDIVKVGDTKYEVIGKRVVGDGPVVYAIPLTAWGLNMEISELRVNLNLLLSSSQQKQISAVLEDMTGDRYKINRLSSDTSDEEALERTMMTITLIIIFTTVGTLLVLYEYIGEKKKRRMSILRMVGCSRRKSVQLYITENIILGVPACAVGILVFLIAEELVLKNVYVYMADIFSTGIYLKYLGVAIIITLTQSVCMGLRNTVRIKNP